MDIFKAFTVTLPLMALLVTAPANAELDGDTCMHTQTVNSIKQPDKHTIENVQAIM